MPRLMSVSMTEQAVVERRKTVTRRKGWAFLKPGDRLTLCRKVMGRQGAPLVRLAEVEVVHVRREPLTMLLGKPDTSLLSYIYGCAEVGSEGFPGMSGAEFVQRFFVDAQGMSPDDVVTRIEWRYLDGGDHA